MHCAKTVCAAVAASVLSLSAAGAHAGSLLTFGDAGVNSNYADIPASYGDYLPGTPNVGLHYRTMDPTGTMVAHDNLEYWSTGYGDLTDVAFAVFNGHVAEVIFTPDAGFSVTLETFDLASYGNSQRTLSTLRILDAANNVLWTSAPATLASGNTHTSFSPNITVPGALRLQWGLDWNAGIDNIAFSQARLPQTEPQVTPVPTPAAASAGFALLGCLAAKRRRA